MYGKLRNLSEMNLLVRSKDRERLQGDGDPALFRLPLPEAIFGDYRLIWATIPNTIYNVNSTNNKLYLFKTGTGDVTLTIPSQNYTGTTLAAALTDLLLAYTTDGPAILVEYLDSVMKLQFTLPDGAEFQIYSKYKEDSAHAILGFRTSASKVLYQLVPGQPNLLPNVVALGLPISLGIQVKESSTSSYALGGNIEDRKLDNNGNTLSIVKTPRAHNANNGNTLSIVKTPRAHNASLVIPFLASAGSYHSSAVDTHRQWINFPRPTKHLNIQLVSPDTHSKVDLNGAEWEMLLSKAEASM